MYQIATAAAAPREEESDGKFPRNQDKLGLATTPTGGRGERINAVGDKERAKSSVNYCAYV